MLYLFTIPVFFMIDLFWLGLVARSFYQSQIGFLLKNNVNWVAAGIFYLLFIAGILIFAVLPAIEKDSFLKAVVFGGLFGFFCYATYDLTSLAVVKDWPVSVTIVDIIWGIFLSDSVASISYFIATRLV